MRYAALLIIVVSVMSCHNSIKLAVPDAFKQQASMQHVSGARGNKMSFDNFTTSKIRRGVHVSYPGWGRGFLLENLLLNEFGIQKNEIVQKEKAKFRYNLSDGKTAIEIYADEKQVTKKLEYKLTGGSGIFSSYERTQQYQYVFSASISGDTANGGKSWDLLMTNIYDRKKENDHSIFTILKQEDNGLATNGRDTIYIKGITTRKTELSNGKTGQMPFAMLTGYELSTSGGVIGIIDLIDRNIWFYNELDAAEKLNIAGIATAILARKVHDAKW
ncbi:hypothetical protein [Ferruginibacter sp.]